ncbi:putative tonsoku-like protein [Apostichopus japonicus]|uniref:Putative tonsoku-like protein n=1 Tax=Stichopus japonicus TaxID=307972 RepID=A0A2G8LCX5_STIJA|nr:putative tonsoku-like protein [Apostichopus japonicus]
MSGIRKDVQRLEKEKAKAQLSSDLKKEAEICNELGELYVQNGQFEEALKEHQQELQLSESTHDVVGAAVAHRRIGECHLELGSFQRAVKHHHKHLNLAKSADSYLEQQRALATIGRTHLCQADVLEGDEQMEALGKSKSAFLGSMRVCENHLQGVVSTREYHEMRARIFLNLGLVFDYQKDFNNSIKFIQQATHISEKNHLNEDLLRCHHSLADIYRNAGEFAKSLTLLGKALQITKSMKNKEKETAILTAQGHIHFQLGDFLAAKKAFKRAYRLGSETDAERLKVTTALQRAIKGCKLEKMIEQAVRDSNQKERMALEEQFGDLCCKMNSYNEAIQHYKRQLDCALSLEVPPLQLIPIYVSLAATYADNKQYSSAVEMYSKELKLRSGNPKEECLTWLNVADAQERAGQEYEVLHQSYKRAVECAETAEMTKLQFRALKSLMLVQEHFKEETHLWLSKKKLNRLKEEQNLPSDYEPSSDEEEEEESNNSLETEDLTLDLSDSGNSEGEQEDFDRPTSSNRAQIAKFSKTNEKGETLLHRACIDGNFRQVKSLLEKGHPVNPRDYCGWLPLHEASNHDHYAIVEILIEHGAAINDRGGAQCGGITPLHDAISCGNLEVAELLVQKGASVIAKDDNGLSALDTLEKWKEMNMGGLDDDVMRQSQNLAEQLLNAAQASPAVVSSTPEVPGNSLLNSDLYDNEEDSQSQSQTGTLSQYQIGPLSQSNKPYGNVSAGHIGNPRMAFELLASIRTGGFIHQESGR